jgi:acetyl esterase
VAQILVYPTVDHSHEWGSMTQFGEGFFLGADQVDWYHDHYILPGTDEADPRVSPLHAADLGRLAPALVVTAGFDPLRDEGEAYAARLNAAGTPVVLRRFPDLIHGFLHFAGLSPAARVASVEVAGAARVLLRSAPL